MKVKLAIIVPTFNKEKYINDLINQAITFQKKYSIKFYFVDDASTDKTIKYLSKYRKQIVIIKNAKNMGQGMTRQIGLSYAIKDNNTHFSFIDADDIYYVDKFEFLWKNILSNPSTILKYSCSSKKNVPKYNDKFKPLKIKKDKITGAPIIFSPLMYTYIIPKKYIKDFQYKYKKKYFYEDGVITHTFLLKHMNNIKSSNIPVIFYHINPNSVTQNANAKYLDDIFIALDALYERNKTYKFQESIAYIFIAEFLGHIYYVFLNKNYKLNFQIKKYFKFIKKYFTKNKLKIAERNIPLHYKILYKSCKWNLYPIYKSLLIIKYLIIKWRQKKLN